MRFGAVARLLYDEAIRSRASPVKTACHGPSNCCRRVLGLVWVGSVSEFPGVAIAEPVMSVSTAADRAIFILQSSSEFVCKRTLAGNMASVAGGADSSQRSFIGKTGLRPFFGHHSIAAGKKRGFCRLSNAKG